MKKNSLNRTIIADNEQFIDVVKHWLSNNNISIPTFDEDRDPSGCQTENLKSDFADASVAMEYYITRQVLLKQLCTVPSDNRIWGITESGKGFDPNEFDRYSCWKGMGMGSCNNNVGYWYYPGMPGCSWWAYTFPSERFDEIFGNNKKLREVVEKSGVLFNSLV